MEKRRRLSRNISDDDEYDQHQDASPLSVDAEDEEEKQRSSAEKEGEGAKPIGDVISVTQKGKHYDSFEFEENVYKLEDTVLIAPTEMGKPYVAIIKDITEDIHGNVMVTGQWFYRPEEVIQNGGGTWLKEDTDSRELFYSFHFDEAPAESIMHKCIVHFVPLHKSLPLRSENPGFIVQGVYDVIQHKIRKLKNKAYGDREQCEIDKLVLRTEERIGKVPYIVGGGSLAISKDDHLNGKILAGEKNKKRPIDVTKVEPTTKLEELRKAYGSTHCKLSKYHEILFQFKVLTGTPPRDIWLEKLLQGVQLLCKPADTVVIKDKQKVGIESSNSRRASKCGGETSLETSNNDINAKIDVHWPNAVVPIITALERVTYEAMGSDFQFQKYNMKMRQLDFNLKKNLNLARRLLRKEIEPIALLTMTPAELKEGLTSDERMSVDPEETEPIWIIDAQCSRCMVKQVRVAEFIYAGGPRDRYQLECVGCGSTWYASRDDITSLTIETPNVAGNVGTAPWATVKFENVEKKMVSPHTPQTNDPLHKSTEAFLPTLESRKLSSKPKSRVPSSSKGQ